MRSKKTQKDWVVEQLRIDGFISRNDCLRNYISRLGAIICNLKKDGMTFDTKHVNGDYRYYLTKDNKQRVVYTIPGTGKQIVRYE